MADPAAIARAFLDAFSKFAAEGNVAGLTSLYGPDSFAAYEGTLQRGQAAISAAFIAPRLPTRIRFSGFNAQATPVGLLLVMVNGESEKPAGRFTQLFALSQLPAGGFYIKADVCRCVECVMQWGPGELAPAAPSLPSAPTALPPTPKHVRNRPPLSHPRPNKRSFSCPPPPTSPPRATPAGRWAPRRSSWGSMRGAWGPPF